MAGDPIAFEVTDAEERILLGVVYDFKTDSLPLTREQASKLHHDLGQALGIETFPPNAVISIEADADMVEQFRDQVDLCLLDPDYRIITNVPMKIATIEQVQKAVESIPRLGQLGQ